MGIKHALTMTTLEDNLSGSIDTASVMGYVTADNRKQFVFDHLKGVVNGPVTKEILVLGMRVFRQYAKDEGISLSELGGVHNRSRLINPNLFH
jgi:hypothetical protein